MKHIPTVAGVLLGLCFLAASIPVLFFLSHLTIPQPPEGTPAAHFQVAFFTTGYVKFVKMFEFIGGLLLLVPRLRNIGLLLVGPVIVNIIAFHTLIEGEPQHLLNPMIIIIVICALYLLWNARSKFAGLLN
jgi:putative oxidoreductase